MLAGSSAYAQPLRYSRRSSPTPNASAFSAVASSSAADMSTSITATSCLVYGQPTYRLSADAVPTVAASRAVGRQACGLSAATTLIADITIAASAASASRVAPRAARRAVSHSGNVSHAWCTSWAISDSCGGSHGNGEDFR